MTCTEGRDGTAVAYSERLLPPWWLWLLAAAFAGAVGVAFAFALGGAAGITAAVLVGGSAVLLLASTVVVIRVDECVIRVGRARLPGRFAGAVTALDAQASITARRSGFDPRAYTVLRTWSSPLTIRIDVSDPADPHPFWLVSSRDPDALAAAIRAQFPVPAEGRLGSDQPGERLSPDPGAVERENP